MNKPFWAMPLCVMLVCVSALAAADKQTEEKPPADMPDTTESAALVEKMPKTVSGTVWLGEKGLAGVRVTDGAQFVTTDADGRYSITLKPDPMIPYLPSRTISVCWPEGAWPADRLSWWKRLKDVGDPQQVDFGLKARQGKLPVCAGFGTDPHDFLRRQHNFIFTKEVARAGRHVDFGVMGGDLGYFGFGNAEEGYLSVKKYTDEFPVTLLHVIGNHDIVGVHSKWWKVPHELSGNGGFTKHVNPIRWSFDYAGIHFIGLDWAHEDEHGKIQCGTAPSAIAWTEEDLASVPKDRPAYLFIHAWGENIADLCRKFPNLKLVLAGHSHRNIFAGAVGGAEWWTKMSLYTLLYIDKDRFDFVDRCIYKQGRQGWDAHWDHHGRACALYVNPEWVKEQRGKHVALENVTLDSAVRQLEPVEGPTFDLRIGARPTGPRPAKRWGVRVTAADGNVYEWSYDETADMLNLLGLKTYFNPQVPFSETKEGWVEMRIYVKPRSIRVIVNSRLHFQRFFTGPIGPAKKFEIFAEGGAAEFGRADLWQRTWPKDFKPRGAANSG